MAEKWIIRPLVWTKSFDSERESYEANIPFGSYSVVRTREDYEKDKPWQPWQWEYSFCEYHDEGYSECANARAGKQAAEEDRHKRLLPALKLADHRED